MADTVDYARAAAEFRTECVAADSKCVEEYASAESAFSEARSRHPLGGPEVERAERRYREALVAARAKRDARQDALWQNLGTLGDPIAKWIVDNCDDNREEGAQVIGALPATLAELDEMAVDQGWCGEWDTYRSAALRAGVVTEPGMTPERAKLYGFLTENYGRLTPRFRARLDELVDALIAAHATAD